MTSRLSDSISVDEDAAVVRCRTTAVVGQLLVAQDPGHRLGGHLAGPLVIGAVRTGGSAWQRQLALPSGSGARSWCPGARSRLWPGCAAMRRARRVERGKVPLQPSHGGSTLRRIRQSINCTTRPPVDLAAGFPAGSRDGSAPSPGRWWSRPNPVLGPGPLLVGGQPAVRLRPLARLEPEPAVLSAGAVIERFMRLDAGLVGAARRCRAFESLFLARRSAARAHSLRLRDGPKLPTRGRAGRLSGPGRHPAHRRRRQRAIGLIASGRGPG